MMEPQSPVSDPAFSRANSRRSSRPRAESTRAESVRTESVYNSPGGPQNTPAQTVINSTEEALRKPVDLRAVEERFNKLQLDSPGLFYEMDTYVPQNTPVTNTPGSCTPASHYRATTVGLPRIDEIIELLPPPCSSKFSSPPLSSKEHKAAPKAADEDTDHSQADTHGLGARTPPDQLLRGVPGVREHTDWHDDIEQDLERDLARLANLAEDDAQRDPSISAHQHYQRRLTRLLSDKKQKFPYTDLPDSPTVSTIVEAASPDSGPQPDYVSIQDFTALSRKVDKLTELIRQVIKAHEAREPPEVSPRKKQLSRHAGHSINGSEDRFA
ncbi:hypothetical protein EJ06DRAFT_342936 [Trichodelitschia bisporula]|uniref:Uncharacterized protein n=1 Tax=Trichodelitschia bisporula TaxID=703511 RepID=A0A6G1I2U1_9PEZI|nr:hypothetical protein EJ06DRAFT_342936 [Trichodelitschia bisporula]